MIKTILRFSINTAICMGLIFTPLLRGQELALPGGDVKPPKVVHNPSDDPFPSGEPFTLSAMVTDDGGTKSVTFFYRAKGEENYQRVNMERIGQTDIYKITLSAEETRVLGIEYYIQATDLAGNSLLRGYSFAPLEIVFKPAEVPPAAKQMNGEPVAKEDSDKKAGMFSKKWVWIGVGVLAVAALAGLAGGGSSGDDPTDPTASLTVSTDAPN